MDLLGRLVLFVVVALVLELVVLIELGRAIGLWPLVALLVGMGIVGVLLARFEGFRVVVAFRRQLATGRLPGRSVLDGICVLLGAVLLFVPGILSDLAAFALLLPPTRRWIQGLALLRLERGIRTGALRVVRLGPPPGFPAGFGWGPEPSDVGEREPELDPSKGIVIEQDER